MNISLASFTASPSRVTSYATFAAVTGYTGIDVCSAVVMSLKYRSSDGDTIEIAVPVESEDPRAVLPERCTYIWGDLAMS